MQSPKGKRDKIHEFCKLRGADAGVAFGVIAGVSAGVALTGGGSVLAYSLLAGSYGKFAGLSAGLIGGLTGLLLSNGAVPMAFCMVAGAMAAIGDAVGYVARGTVYAGQSVARVARGGANAISKFSVKKQFNKLFRKAPNSGRKPVRKKIVAPG